MGCSNSHRAGENNNQQTHKLARMMTRPFNKMLYWELAIISAIQMKQPNYQGGGGAPAGISMRVTRLLDDQVYPYQSPACSCVCVLCYRSLPTDMLYVALLERH